MYENAGSSPSLQAECEGSIPFTRSADVGALFLAVAIWFAAHAGALGGALPSPGCLDGGDPARIGSIGPELDIVLVDARDIILPGIEPVRPSSDAEAKAAQQALSRWLVGQTVNVRTLAAEPDRWGRTVALAFADQTTPATGARVSVAEAILDAGFARARPDPRLGDCWRVFVDDEARARAAGLGLWTQSRYAVIAADDRARLLTGTGSMVIVEGRIARIGEGRTRTYLSFGDSRNDFAITVERRMVARLRAAGLDPVTWRGRQVRVRGFLDDRFGLQIDLTSVDQIEFTDHH